MTTTAYRPLALLIASLFVTPSAPSLAASLAPDALPTGARVTAGAASVTQPANSGGARMDIKQTTDRAILDWQTFNIGTAAQVNFAQPSAASTALNRVAAGEASQIMGRLTANGQVYLVNPAGVIFGAGSRVDVGGLVASTLDIKDDDFLAGRKVFKRNAVSGKVENHGTLNAADGGLIALLAPEVRNEGVISARLGNVVLAAGERVTLEAGADGRLQVAVDPATINALVDNRQMIVADGGQVVMSAQAADRLYSAVVANSGTVQARTLQNRDGRILLLADMDHGEVQVGGTLDASAPSTPSPLAGEGRGEGATTNGGFVETSAAHVKVTDSARVTTLAANGKNGTWLIDPNDYTIAASGGDISGATLATNLAGGNVTILSSQGATAGNGDIFVNDAVSWSANTTLSLQAERDIQINANLTATGNTAGLTLGHGAGRDYYVNNGAKITLSGNAPVLKIGVAAAEVTYIVINSLGVAGDATTTTLQGMTNNLTGKYALGSDIDASATAGWNAGAGFEPVGAGWCCGPSNFNGVFYGLGHSVSGLTINRPSAHSVGMFGTGTGMVIRDVHLVSGSVIGNDYVGGLIGQEGNGVRIANVSFDGTVSGNNEVGGLIGFDNGTVSGSYSSGTVNGNNSVGGLIGNHWGGSVSNAYSTATTTGNTEVGGLIGHLDGVNLSNSYSTGSVSGNGSVGGLIGGGGGNVSNSFYNIDMVSINGNHWVGRFGIYNSQYQDWLSGAKAPLNLANYSASLPQSGDGAYLIGSYQGLKDLLGFYDQTNTFRLTADLDLSGLSGYYIPQFKGVFDGAGHTLSNLTVNRGVYDRIGFVGSLGSGATIQNLVLLNIAVTGGSYVGGLVGGNGGTVSNSYATGSVSGGMSRLFI